MLIGLDLIGLNSYLDWEAFSLKNIYSSRHPVNIYTFTHTYAYIITHTQTVSNQSGQFVTFFLFTALPGDEP